jgi:glycerophosphoryl diester phosphodiesterase
MSTASRYRARVQQRLPSLLDPPIGFAHRGARAHAQENTIEAFALGLRLGATGLESDVWLTNDGVPVLDHDGVARVGRRRRSLDQLRWSGGFRSV